MVPSLAVIVRGAGFTVSVPGTDVISYPSMAAPEQVIVYVPTGLVLLADVVQVGGVSSGVISEVYVNVGTVPP